VRAKGDNTAPAPEVDEVVVYHESCADAWRSHNLGYIIIRFHFVFGYSQFIFKHMVDMCS
jgi:hypothetical protein